MTLWICEVGDGPAERVICDTEDLGEVINAALETADEVDCSAMDKYFLFDDNGRQQTFICSSDLVECLKKNN